MLLDNVFKVVLTDNSSKKRKKPSCLVELSIMSKRTATLKYYALNNRNEMTLRRIEQVPTGNPNESVYPMIRRRNNILCDKFVAMVLYFLFLIGAIFMLYGVGTGTIFKPTQFILMLQENVQTISNKIGIIIDKFLGWS